MKRKFESGDCVKLSNPYQDKYEYGYIDEYDKKSKDWVVRVKGSCALIHVPASDLVYMPPFILSDDVLGKLLRYEYTCEDYTKNIIPDGNWEYEDPYEYSLEDMIALVYNLQDKKPTNQEITAWVELVFCEFEDLYWHAGNPEFDDERPVMVFSSPKNDAAMALSIYSAFYNFMLDDTSGPASAKIDISQIFSDIENYKQNKPMKQHLWTIGNKLSALSNAEDAKLRALSLEEKSELRSIILELTELGYANALSTLGYAYYGGNELFPCDWDKSRDCFLKLLEMDNVADLDKCQYANTLGYIFYYGRCNNGIPEYEKAYQYFALGAAGGMYESMYKLADMYAHGYGVTKNTRAAMTLVNMVYTENLRLIKKERFDCQFADAALRMGNLCRDGIMHDDEYYYYTLADFAIRKRLAYDYYGDAHVFSGIQKELARIRENRPLKKVSTITSSYAPGVFENLFNKHSCIVKLRPVKNGIKITAKRLPKPGRDDVKSVFECYPEYGYCNLISKASMTVFGPELPLLNEKQSFVADGFDVIWVDGGLRCSFTHHGEEQFTFAADKFTRKLSTKSKKAQTEYLFASVVFNKGGHTYDYICDIADAVIGDKVIVLANGEEKEVEIVRLFNMVIGDMPLAVEKYKKILRKA